MNLGHITGLDPAGPYLRNLNLNEKLDPSDADNVEVGQRDRFVAPKKLTFFSKFSHAGLLYGSGGPSAERPGN